MKHIIALLFVVLSAIGADTPVAIVSGTNVLYTAVADTNRFVPKTGSIVVINREGVGVVGPGWRYVAGEFFQPDGKPIANGIKAKIIRAQLIDAAVAKLNAMQSQGTNAVANWASLTALQKDSAQKLTIDAVVTCSRILELLLLEQRELLEMKEAR